MIPIAIITLDRCGEVAFWECTPCGEESVRNGQSHHQASLAQMVESHTSNVDVSGSSPEWWTNYFRRPLPRRS